MNILIYGYPSTGKSTIAKALQAAYMSNGKWVNLVDDVVYSTVSRPIDATKQAALLEKTTHSDEYYLIYVCQNPLDIVTPIQWDYIIQTSRRR